jgi:quercetin dioxygenase-like cupin family protein
MKISTRKILTIAAIPGALMLAGAALAQPTALQRTIVQTQDVSVPGREAVVARVEIAPAGVAGWHTHPGDEISYIMEGEVELLIAGKPSRVYKAGEGFVIPAGTVHSAKNSGSVPVKLVGVYVVEKGKPLATPAPAPAPVASAAPDKPAEGFDVTGSRFKIKDKAQSNVQSGADIQSSGAKDD